MPLQWKKKVLSGPISKGICTFETYEKQTSEDSGNSKRGLHPLVDAAVFFCVRIRGGDTAAHGKGHLKKRIVGMACADGD